MGVAAAASAVPPLWGEAVDLTTPTGTTTDRAGA